MISAAIKNDHTAPFVKPRSWLNLNFQSVLAVGYWTLCHIRRLGCQLEGKKQFVRREVLYFIFILCIVVSCPHWPWLLVTSGDSIYPSLHRKPSTKVWTIMSIDVLPEQLLNSQSLFFFLFCFEDFGVMEYLWFSQQGPRTFLVEFPIGPLLMLLWFLREEFIWVDLRYITRLQLWLDVERM